MWTIIKKELLELSRDRKTLIFIILLPMLIFPVIFGIAGVVFANQAVQAQEKVLKFVIVGDEHAPTFSQTLHYHKLFNRIEMPLTGQAEIENAINAQQVDFVLVVPEDFSESGTLTSTSNWKIYYNGASSLNLVNEKLNRVMSTYQAELRQNEMQRLGISASKQSALLDPIIVEKVNTAPPREDLGEKLGGFIPYLLLPLCLSGAMYAAIDLGAGEKERGTLETLLLSPVPYRTLVFGKFTAIMVGALLTASVTLLSLGLWGGLLSTFVDFGPLKDILASIRAIELILIFLLLLPVCAIFSSLLLALSIYARSYKEAQNYMGPLTILVILPIMFSLLPGVDLDGVWGWVPITNVALGIKELLKGTMELSSFVPIFLSTFAIAGALLAFCVKWFSREDVLFR